MQGATAFSPELGVRSGAPPTTPGHTCPPLLSGALPERAQALGGPDAAQRRLWPGKAHWAAGGLSAPGSGAASDAGCSGIENRRRGQTCCLGRQVHPKPTTSCPCFLRNSGCLPTRTPGVGLLLRTNKPLPAVEGEPLRHQPLKAPGATAAGLSPARGSCSGGAAGWQSTRSGREPAGRQRLQARALLDLVPRAIYSEVLDSRGPELGCLSESHRFAKLILKPAPGGWDSGAALFRSSWWF